LPLLEKVNKTIKTFTLFQPGQTVLVAVSGGPDSLALLHVLHRQAKTLGVRLHVGHVNHGLRPEAAAEAVSVKKEALRLGVPVSVCRVDVHAHRKKRGLSLQAAAREARYGALAALAGRIGAHCLATAHHRDDRVETLLIRLLCGSGLDGLAGIPVQRRLAANLVVVRPFYDVTREEIEEYCTRHSLHPLRDPTNLKPVCLRNRVRLELLPYLERQYGTHVRRMLANTAENLAEDAAFMSRLGRQAFLGTAQTRDRQGILLDTVILHRIPPALQKRALRHALWRAGVERPGRLQVEQLLTLADHKSPSACCRLPGGVLAQRRYSGLWLGKTMPPETFLAAVTEIIIPGTTELTCCGLRLFAETRPAAGVDVKALSPQEACLDAEKLTWPLRARSRRDGDRMWPLGAPGHRKVKKILADRKIPRADRAGIPVIISGEEIVWLGGVEIAEPCKVTDATEAVLYLKLINDEKDGAR
jgi:tRNA(Ile)-lysidine synthase